MKSYEMVETLSDKAHVTLEQAKDALEKSNWDMLDAAIYLERTKGSMNAPTYPQGPGYQYVSSQQNSFGGQFRQPPFPPNPPYPPQPGFKQPPRGNFPPKPGRQPGFNPPPFGNPGFNGAPPFKNPGNPGYNPQGKSVDEFLNKASNKAEKVIGDGTSNFFVVRRNGEKLIQLPILLFIIILLATLPVFPIVIVILIAGLVFECKYSFEGKTIENMPINNVMNTTANFAKAVKNDIKNAAVDLSKSVAQSAQEVQSEQAEPKTDANLDSVPNVDLEKPADTSSTEE